MIEIIVYRKDAESIETGFATHELPQLLANRDNLIWVDMMLPSEADRIEANAILKDVFHFHQLTIEDAHETRNQPKIEAYSDHLFFILHGVKTETTFSNFVTKELDGYLGANYVVTYHHERFRSIDKVKRNIADSIYSCQRGPAFLLHQILDELVDLYMPIVDDFDSTISDLEERIFRMRRGNNQILSEIMNLKRSVARLRRISTKQLDVLYKMSHGQFPLIDEKMQPFYRDVHDHLMRISDLAENYRDLVSGLLDIHFSVIANKTNDVMKVLAVFSAIMLPLSLIAGIYGMNVRLYGDTDHPYYFWEVVLVMALIAVGLLFYFWKRGWIGGGDFIEIETDDKSPEN